MTTVSIKQLANGKLGGAVADMYTAPTSGQTIIKAVTLVNTNSTAETVNLYILPSGGATRQIIPNNMSLGAGFLCVIDDVITLNLLDKLQGITTTSGKIDFVVSGVEESV